MTPDSDDPMITVCQGPDICGHMSGPDDAEIMAKCPWCIRIICHPDGTETRLEPSKQ